MPIEVDKAIADEMDKLADSAWSWLVFNTHPVTGLTLDRGIRWENLKNCDSRTGKPVLAYGFDGVMRHLLRAGADVRSSENLMPGVPACGSRGRAIGPWCWENMTIVFP